MPTISERIETVVSALEADKVIQHAIVHGPASGTGSTVTTEGGPVRTFAKVQSDSEIAYGNAATNAATATTQAGIATTQAGIATTQAGIATTQAGLAATSATTALNAISQAYKGDVAGGSVPATSTAAGDTYRITSVGTSQSKTWAIGDAAIYKGSSGQWTQLTGFYTASNTAFTPTGNVAATTMQGAVAELDAEKVPYTAVFGMKNRLINGMFLIDQQALNSVADAAYHLDQWYALTESGNVTIARLTNPEDGQLTCLRMTQPDVTAKRMGSAQPIETNNCRDLRGQTVALRARIRCSSSQAIRWAVIEWTGTANAITKDVVSSWTNATFTTGNFFISTTTTIAATGSVTPAANTWTDLLASATISSSANNLIVFIWSEGTLAQNATLDLGAVQLAQGAQTPFEARPVGMELALAQRYLQKNEGSCGGFSISTTTGEFNVPLFVPMLATPSIQSVSNGTWVDGVGAAAVTSIALATGYLNGSVRLTFNSTGLTALRAVSVVGQSILLTSRL